MPGKITERPKILIFCDYYLPGYKSGGGMRTIVNMIDRLHERYDFLVVTRDHDGALDREPYENVKIGEWNEVGQAKVYYLSKTDVRPQKLRRLILEAKPDALYVNSFFATLTIYVLILRKLRLIPELPVVLAPEGELSGGAIKLKTFKKKAFVALTKIPDIYDDLIWKACSELEKNEIAGVKGDGDRIFIAPNTSPKMILPEFDRSQKPEKRRGAVKMIFLSRFARKKNFKWLLEILPRVAGRVEIDVWGPIEDAEYWRECEKIIEVLPENIKVEARGSIPHAEAARKMLDYHFFVLPTLGENFGHVFVEALAAGCPLLISDSTPWLDLEKKKIGWDLPLEAPEKWIETFNYCVALDDNDYRELSANARNYAVRWLEDDSVEKKTAEVLNYSLLRAAKSKQA